MNTIAALVTVALHRRAHRLIYTLFVFLRVVVNGILELWYHHMIVASFEELWDGLLIWI